MAHGDEPPPDARSVFPEWTDAELVQRLRKAEFAGDEWHAAEAVLVAMAIPVLHDMLLGQKVVQKSVALHRPVVPTADEAAALRGDQDARADLVHTAVVEGIRVFRRVSLEGGGWDPDGRASLMSYVVNGCVLALANPFRAWRAQRRRAVDTEMLDLERADRLVSAEPDPLTQLLDEEDHTALLGSMAEPLARAARLWIETGWPWVRIAQEIKISPRSLEGHLRRWRRQHRQRKDGL